ncbi:MAG: hypothetical protein U0575_14755 [Phycisphaerales bacterium]
MSNMSNMSHMSMPMSISGAIRRGSDLDRIVRDWARIGASFNVEPAPATPDLEQLIVDTVRAGRDHARLLIVAATWLRAYGALVARHRLARLAVSQLGETERAILGWLIDESLGANRRYREVRAVCRPASRLRSVFRVHERHADLLERLERSASPHARRWNLLAESLPDKPDALRATAWILRNNPSLALRALLEGDLRASILAAIEHDGDAGASELELARRCGASRAAVRNALTRLELAGHVDRRRVGRNTRIEAHVAHA